MGVNMHYSLRFKTVLCIVYLTIAACFIGLPFSFLAFGSELSTRQSNLYPYRTSIFLQDEFLGGSTASNSIGSLGWNAANGATTNLAGEANRFGIIRRDTSAVINTIATLFINSASAAAMNPANNHSFLAAIRLNTNDANTTIRIGGLNSTAISPPADGIYFEKLDADTNWFCVTRAGGVQTRTDSSIAVNTSFNTFEYIRNSSGVTYKINNANVCTNTTNITATYLNLGFHITNSAAAAKTADIDYAQIIFTGLSR
jgi:hypothetical protein